MLLNYIPPFPLNVKVTSSDASSVFSVVPTPASRQRLKKAGEFSVAVSAERLKHSSYSSAGVPEKLFNSKMLQRAVQNP